MVAFFLGGRANQLGWVDPAAALQLATEGLALARQSGMPIAIAWNLCALAQAIAPDDPNQARALLDESLQLTMALGYETHGVQTAPYLPLPASRHGQ